MSEAQTAQRDDSPMDVDQPSPLEQDPAPLGMTHLETADDNFRLVNELSIQWAQCVYCFIFLWGFVLISPAITQDFKLIYET